jgi:hypothetical protein
MEINKCSEAEAKKELKLIAEDSQITGQDTDWIPGDGEEEQEEAEPDNAEEEEGNDG